nr:MAG TPA: hypothetical protein [Caudoviricetes sp.]
MYSIFSLSHPCEYIGIYYTLVRVRVYSDLLFSRRVRVRPISLRDIHAGVAPPLQG